jgi:DNA-damage-inducible protein D
VKVKYFRLRTQRPRPSLISHWRDVAEKKAKKACENAGEKVPDHFREVTKMVRLGSGSERAFKDIAPRYACYLVAQNGDAGKQATLLPHD